MIARLTGTIETCRPTETVISVNGVGYGCMTPLSVFNTHQVGQTATLHIHTYLKEDQLRLFGFCSEHERDLFRLLISVSGIGPSMGISILSGIDLDDLVGAVINNAPDRFIHIPGIGKSKAEKLVFELRRKEKKLLTFSQGSALRDDQRVDADAVEALISLGFDQKTASSAVSALMAENSALNLEECIRGALKRLS